MLLIAIHATDIKITINPILFHIFEYYVRVFKSHRAATNNILRAVDQFPVIRRVDGIDGAVVQVDEDKAGIIILVPCGIDGEIAAREQPVETIAPQVDRQRVDKSVKSIERRCDEISALHIRHKDYAHSCDKGYETVCREGGVLVGSGGIRDGKKDDEFNILLFEPPGCGG
jgi:hypothetical protein